MLSESNHNKYLEYLLVLESNHVMTTVEKITNRRHELGKKIVLTIMSFEILLELYKDSLTEDRYSSLYDVELMRSEFDILIEFTLLHFDLFHGDLAIIVMYSGTVPCNILEILIVVIIHVVLYKVLLYVA